MPIPAHALLMAAGTSAPATFTDDFNRSDRNLNGDNGWTTTIPGSVGSISIVSNVCTGVGTTNGAYATNTGSGLVTGDEHFVEFDIVSNLSGNIASGLCRYIDPGNFYTGRINAAGGGHLYEIYRRNSSTYTLLNSLDEAFPSLPFRVRFEIDVADDMILSLWSGGTWVSKVTGNSNSIGGGVPGISIQRVSSDCGIDNYTTGNN